MLSQDSRQPLSIKNQEGHTKYHTARQFDVKHCHNNITANAFYDDHQLRTVIAGGATIPWVDPGHEFW